MKQSSEQFRIETKWPECFIILLQKVICPEVLHEDVIVVKGRLVLVQDYSEIQRPESCQIVTGSTGEKVCVTKWIFFFQKTILM